MTTRTYGIRIGILRGIVTLAAIAGAAIPHQTVAAADRAAAITRQQIEADWLQERTVRGLEMPLVVQRGRQLADSLRRLGANVEQPLNALNQAGEAWRQLPRGASDAARRALYFRARDCLRRLALANPLLDFDDLLFVKRVPGSFCHMCDQYYGWFSRPGGGLYVLEGFKSAAPRLRCLSGALPLGSVLRPDLSADCGKVLFAHCKYYPNLAGERNKLDKANVPEDAFYHLYEVSLDGSGLRRLTWGKYDDFDGRYLPDGRIVFLSTRRGQDVQCRKSRLVESVASALPDSYVRCGGGAERPVAVYTLHAMDADGKNIVHISPFESFEWTPSIDRQGRILYARWDYIDRFDMPFMKLWATRPDGSMALAVWGNFVSNPYCTFEPRAVPGSPKIVCTASAHHCITGGSLVLLDPRQGNETGAGLTRLTPEVCFPESEGNPRSYFAGPYPLSEEHYLVSWSAQPLPASGLGLYLFDVFGNLTLLYRDAAIGCETPLPIKRRQPPRQLPPVAADDAAPEGRMLVVNVYDGLGSLAPGTIRRLRLVGVPPKTQPNMNSPVMGVTARDPGKFVLGTVPVEKDGSAWFRAPAGVNLFFQALDEKGVAVQTMRSVTYVQPGETVACMGCHEPRTQSPPVTSFPLAVRREPSKITPGVEGSWPLDYQVLVQPVLDKHCLSCHRPGGKSPRFDLTAARSYNALLGYGKPSLREHVQMRYQAARSIVGAGAAATSALLPLVARGHYGVELSGEDRQRLVTWMDTYGQRLGSYDKGQEERLRELRHRMAPMLTK